MFINTFYNYNSNSNKVKHHFFSFLSARKPLIGGNNEQNITHSKAGGKKSGGFQIKQTKNIALSKTSKWVSKHLNIIISGIGQVHQIINVDVMRPLCIIMNSKPFKPMFPKYIFKPRK
jgi:hypothetical protein